MVVKTNSLKRVFLVKVFLLILFSQSVLSQQRVAGVKPGQYVVYSLEWERPPFEGYPIEVRREILEVEGPNVRVRIVTRYSNGSVSEDEKTGDVSEGTGGAALIFIPANLSKGDVFGIRGLNDTIIILDEMDLWFERLGVSRRVVYSSFTTKGGYDIKAYWDKVKGVALEINYSHDTWGNNRIVAVETNMFTSSTNNQKSSNWGFYFALATVIIVLFALLLRRRKKVSRRKVSKRL